MPPIQETYAGRRFLACISGLPRVEQELAVALWRADPYVEEDAQWGALPARVTVAARCLELVEDELGHEREFARWMGHF